MKKALLASLVLLMFPVTVVATAPEYQLSGFEDVPNSHPNAEAIAYVRTTGIVQGYSDGTFRPDQRINRAEFTKIIIEATEHTFIDEYTNGKCFSDVGQEWFAKYICYAKAHAIISGYEDKAFRPEQPINLVEAAKIMVYAFLLPQGGVAPGDPWYKQYILGLEMGHAVPLSLQSFSQRITRGEMAEMVYRVMAGVTNKPSRSYDELLKTASWRTYTDTRLLFEVQYPPDWKLSKEGNRVNFMPIGGQDISMVMYVYALPINEVEKLMPVFSVPGRSIDSRTTTTLNGVEWVTLVSGGQIVQLTSQNGKTYAVQYFAEDTLVPPIVSSIRFI